MILAHIPKNIMKDLRQYILACVIADDKEDKTKSVIMCLKGGVVVFSNKGKFGRHEVRPCKQHDHFKYIPRIFDPSSFQMKIHQVSIKAQIFDLSMASIVIEKGLSVEYLLL